MVAPVPYRSHHNSDPWVALHAGDNVHLHVHWCRSVNNSWGPVHAGASHWGSAVRSASVASAVDRGEGEAAADVDVDAGHAALAAAWRNNHRSAHRMAPFR